MICDALQDERFNTPPKLKNNCVRVFYNEGYHIDVPAYRRIEVQDAWTGKIEYSYELASVDWRNSDPREVTRWFSRENSRLSPNKDADNDGQFRRIVRLAKAFARSHSSWKAQTTTGLMITKLVSEQFVAADERDDTALRTTLRNIEKRLQWEKRIAHPVVDDEFITKDDDTRPEFLKDKLADNLPFLDVLDITDCSHETAMAAWDNFFNTDWFSQQPEPDGGIKQFATPAAAVEKKGGGRYARNSWWRLT
jgi:hypothetical protein